MTHFIYDRDQNSFKSIQSFAALRHHVISYSKTRQSLYALLYRQYGYLWKFNAKHQNWAKLKLSGIKSLRDTGDCAFVITNDEKYALIFENDVNGTIDIFDIENNTMRRSKLKFPAPGFRLRGFLTDNFEKSDVIIHGYLKKCWDQEMFRDFDELPEELIQLLTLFYAQVDAHIMTLDDGGYYKVPLNELLQWD